ncbi:AMP-binding protein [Alkalihalobacillus clausii]|uniref:AMP-binding protein n=1 Tax=Shouchella clausii TaxID=79880 RepID=UPI000BA553AA|nr:AMP-binding protein [Shouchella clausii]MCM3550034.1 AMP-binding protein [Shouchella clausii]PAF15031.1 hypothetical protein CHH59_05880 [Shouchella clausii]
MNGKINYFTGGTTGKPKAISYNASRWKRSVSNTLSILNIHGINSYSKVIVGFPFSPWAIGNVFTEALLRCGAEVFPLGLSIKQEGFFESILNESITHICAPPRTLISIQRKIQGYNKKIELQKVFVAGEELTEKQRRNLKDFWKGEVVNIYGKAELDTIGFERNGNSFFTLLDKFNYKLRTSHNFNIDLATGLSGELLIQEPGKPYWIRTGDVIEVVTQERLFNNDTWGVKIKHRIDDTITLSCGANVSSYQVYKLKKKFYFIEHVQIIFHDIKGDDYIDINLVIDGEKEIDKKEICNCFINSSVDIYDSFSQGMIHKINVNVIEEEDLIRTKRDKIKNLIKI